MAETVTIAARSNHGCWTCRLRKKKCDETRPACSACSSLDLECHGYGSRPGWMDNGFLQRDKASKFKRLVSQAKSKKGRRQQSSANLALLDLTAGIKASTTENLSSSTVVSQSYLDEHFQVGAFSHDVSNYHDIGIESSTSINALCQILPPNDNSTMNNALLNIEGYSPTYTIAHNQDSPSNLISPMAFETILSGNDIQSHVNQNARSVFYGVQDNHSQNQNHNLRETTSITNYAHEELASQITSLTGDTEDELFMHYLDEVFYIQYPFFHCQRKQGRGWLFAILRRVKSVYHAALALSERQLLSSSSSRNIDIAMNLIKLRAQSSHYDIAIREMYVMIDDPSASTGRDPLLHNIEILMSIIQLLFFETFNGGRENWQQYLRTATGCISTLLQSRFSPLRTPDDSIVPHGENEMAALCPEIESAFKFVLGSFIAFDIISSASTRSNLILNINHLQILETFKITLESHTGCRDSVMALVLEISLLDQWKKEVQAAKKLSFVNLVKRGEGIQCRLRRELAAIENEINPWVGEGGEPSPAPLLATATPSISAPTHPEISKVFILSAMTYLHVVISGPYPEVPEIAESISESIHAFKTLQDPRLLRNLVWPICISGCLAMDIHYDFFRGLVSRAGITQYDTGVCFGALQIMEECWKARVASSESCDWATAMQRRGPSVFLG